MATAKSTAGSAPGNPRLAYWDTFAGLIPVKVLSLSTIGNANVSLLTADDAFLRVQVTGARGPYQRGHEPPVARLVPLPRQALPAFADPRHRHAP